MALTKEEILSVKDVQVKEITVPEWGTSDEPAEVFIRTINGQERDRLENLAFKKQFDNYRAKCAVTFLSDSEGKRLFNDADVPAVARKNAAALVAIVDAGVDFNRMEAETEEAE